MPCEHEKNVYFAVVGWSILQISVNKLNLPSASGEEFHRFLF